MTRVHYEILPEAQRRLLPVLAPLRGLGFVLYGGTAIALQPGHRSSVDFEFFTNRPMDREAMRGTLPWLENADVIQDEADGWIVLTSGATPVKVSFFSGLGFGRVGRPIAVDEGILLASLDDLLGHKLKVLLQRVEAKDYRDIAAMLTAGLELERGLGAATALFANFPPCEAMKARVYFGDGDLATVGPDERAILVARADQAGKPIPLPIVSASLSEI